MSINAITCPKLVSPCYIPHPMNAPRPFKSSNLYTESSFSSRRQSNSSTSSSSSHDDHKIDNGSNSVLRRREKNKLASAKYRAKKQYMIHSMQAHIMQLASQVKTLKDELVQTKKNEIDLFEEYQRLYNHCKHHHSCVPHKN
ncbi:unnamed protein product [Rhizopus stolonifer]